ncbi:MULTISPECIES: hypothetical protein [Streptomyces]|uniref:Uncharacterized protein n=1 Tax=Streptomyces mordarskii TaxID=1226758 RepID=A0ABN1DPA8_9ACTN|nr:hypothetical protein OG751_05980 [Streptomyces antimycoticus]WTB10250.1 hypothetical protein OG546_42580 [Streptomyces antimycoticus]
MPFFYTAAFQMITPARKKALRTATVDPQRIRRAHTRQDREAGRSGQSLRHLLDNDLGSYALEYLENDWYTTD